MDSVIFSRSELEKLNTKQLKVLLRYYNLPVPKLKAEKIEVLENFYRPMVQSNDEPQMSVRIRRIKEASNGT